MRERSEKEKPGRIIYGNFIGFFLDFKQNKSYTDNDIRFFL